MAEGYVRGLDCGFGHKDNSLTATKRMKWLEEACEYHGKKVMV